MARARLPLPVTAGVVVSLWLPYALLNTIYPGPILTYTLGLCLAGVALGALWLAGIPPRQCFVCLAPLSPRGAVILLVVSAFIPLALAVGRGQPWNGLYDLVYAPASAIAQELYFRATLLTVLVRLSPGQPSRANVAQALLFALWHARAFRVVAQAPALGALLVTFLGGWLWGWQAKRDGTVVYAAAQHTLFLIVQ